MRPGFGRHYLDLTDEAGDVVYSHCVVGDRYILLQEFFRHPAQTGALAPSSPGLADQITAIVRAGSAVLELGPGTGPLTAAIQRRLDGRGRHLAVEINPRLAGLVAERWPGVTVACADAADVARVLAERELGPVDTVVSSLPWANFSGARQREIMDGLRAALAPDGRFTTYAYAHARGIPAARRYWRLLPEYFERVSVSPVIWSNMPPAVIYRAARPRR